MRNGIQHRNIRKTSEEILEIGVSKTRGKMMGTTMGSVFVSLIGEACLKLHIAMTKINNGVEMERRRRKRHEE